MALLSLRAYARHRKTKGMPGGTFAAVNRAIEDGRITLTNGKVDPDSADRMWAENSRNEATESYSDARARKEAALADVAEMEAAKMRGELHRGDDVDARWSAVTATIRAKLLTLPPTVAPLVAGKPLPECLDVLHRHVFEALMELSGEQQPRRH